MPLARLRPLCLLPLALLAQPAAAIRLTDYLEPESRYEQAFLLGNFNSRSGNQDQTSYDLTLRANYEHNYSSLPRTWQLRLDGATDISRGAERGDEQQETSSANAHLNIDNYLAPDSRRFWFGAADAGYLSDADDPFFKLGGGLGVGRVIDATPLAKVLRFEEELRAHGIVRGPISDATYLALARLVARQDEFRARYGEDEYKPYWFAAMEELLRVEGVLYRDRLGAAGALYMDRVLFDESVSVREHGWLLRGGVGLVVRDFHGNKGNPSLDGVYEYARPFGWRGQLIERLNVSVLLSGGNGYLLGNTLSYTHELSNRIDWENRWEFTFQDGDDETDHLISHVVTSTFHYYLTNRLNLDATVSVTRVSDDIEDNGNDDTSVTTFLGVRYRLR